MPLNPPAALPDDSARASLEKAMKEAEKTSAKVAGKLKSAAVAGAKVAGVGAAVVAAPVAVVSAPVWAPAALIATPVIYEGGKLVGGAAVGAAKWAVDKVEHANAKQEQKAEQRFAVQNAEMISALSQPLPGGLTTNPAVRNLLADHIKGSATQMSPEEAVQMAAIGEHIYKALSEGKKAGPNGLEVNIPGRDSPLLVPPGNFAAKAVSWHIMAAAAQANLDRQNLPGAKRDDMTNSGTFILKDPGNNVYDFLNANPMVAERMSSHYEERLDHDKKVPVLGKTLQKGCDDYQNKFPGGGGALLFDKLKGGEIFVKFEHAGTPNPVAKEGHDSKKHTAMRAVLAANRWVEHSFSFLESLKAGAGDPNKVVRQEDIHKGEMKAAVYEPYLATLKAATEAGIITKREAEAMKSHARSNGLPSVQGGLDILKERQQNTPGLDPAKSASFTLAAQVLEKNIDYKLQSMGQGNNDLGIQRRGGEVHLSADPNKYLPAQGPAQQVDAFDPPAVMSAGFTLHENTDKTNAQASESYSMRSDEGQVLGAKGETRAFAKPQLDASAFPGLKAQEESITQDMKALAKDSDGLSQWSQKKNQIEGIDGEIVQAEKDLANSVVGLARANASGNEQQKATWQNNVDVDQAKLDKLLDLKSRPDELAAELDQLSKHPDVVSFKQMSDQLDEVKRQLAPMESVAKASSALYKNMMDMNEDASLGGDRALLARSVATYQVDQLLGTNVIAEEKMAVTPEGRLMGVSVQADGAQVTGKHEEKDCFLKTDYSDPRIQKGMADLEAVDYITGQIDRHNGNIFVHPESGKVTGIDNDLAFPEHKRADVLASDPGLGEKAVKTMPRLMSQETADKILATKPEQLADLLKGMQNPDGAGGLSPAEIQGAVDRLQELQNAIKAPASGVQVVKEFNQQTYETSIQQQRDLLAEQTGLDDFKQPAADFKDVDNASLMAGAHKASYLGAAVMVGQKYELLQGQSADGVEFGIRDGKTANVAARVDPEFAEYKKQEHAARQSLAANPNQIENPNVKRDVIKLQTQVGELQQQIDACQKQIDKLDAGPQNLRERAKAALHIGRGTDEKRQDLAGQKQEILQNLKQAQAGLDKALDKAVQPLQAELRMDAREKIAEKGAIAQQNVDDRAVKLEALRELAKQNGIDPKMVELGGLGEREPSLKKMLDVAVNKDINAASFRERAGEIKVKSPAEAVLANLKGDRDESIGKAIREAVAALKEGGPELSASQKALLMNTFDAARQQCDIHDQEEKVQNGQRLELYQKEVTDTLSPLLQAQKFTPQEIAVFAEAAVKLGLEAESAALKNNAAHAKMYADQLKDGLQNSPFKYSDHNPEASKLHDALYRANNANAHVHADGDVEIKRGHASFQEKTANRILADVAALKGVVLDPVKAAQMLEVHAPKAENSVAGMLGRHRPNAPLPAPGALKAAEGLEGGKADVRASLGIQRAPKPPGVGKPEVEKPDVGKVGAKWQPAKPKEGQGGPAAKPLGKTV